MKYQIYSTVLGNTITETRANGSKVKTKIFAGGAVIAEQIRNNATDQKVKWIHADPLTGSKIEVFKDGAATSGYRTEYEPLGQEIQPLEPIDPPLSLTNETGRYSASDAEWLCRYPDKEESMMPIACQKAANESLEWWTEYKESTPQKIMIDSPLPSFEYSPSDETLSYALASSSKKDKKLKRKKSDGAKGQIPETTVDVKIPAIDMSEIPGADASVSGDNMVAIPLPTNFKDLIKNRLSKGDCNDFIGKLILKVVENYNNKLEKLNKEKELNLPKYSAQAVDGYDLLKIISGQRGFILKDHLTVSGWLVSGTVSGSIKGNDAQVIMATRFKRPDSKYDPTKMWIDDYVMTAIHEMIHLTGNGVFLDQDLARATYDLGQNKKPVKSETSDDINEILNYSSDWDTALRNHCGENTK